MRNLTQEEINKILLDLNGAGTADWSDSGLNVGLPTVTLDSNGPNVDLGQTVITRLFVNGKTGELKFTVIKVITGE